jgi:hypothetical protein
MLWPIASQSQRFKRGEEAVAATGRAIVQYLRGLETLTAMAGLRLDCEHGAFATRAPGDGDDDDDDDAGRVCVVYRHKPVDARDASQAPREQSTLRVTADTLRWTVPVFRNASEAALGRAECTFNTSRVLVEIRRAAAVAPTTRISLEGPLLQRFRCMHGWAGTLEGVAIDVCASGLSVEDPGMWYTALLLLMVVEVPLAVSLYTVRRWQIGADHDVEYIPMAGDPPLRVRRSEIEVHYMSRL